ncbi:hypothetical protein H8H78_18625, partial [Bacillus pumilus]|nr:hypothetical protein [Bacillus pumilus]
MYKRQVADYTAFLEAAETEYFDVIAPPVDNSEQLKATFASFIERLRDKPVSYTHL